ncbi:MAG: peptide chain release factor N(5)-glutamine methyltransferase [Pseudomonadota bacterium]|nr:peptide chain release factor N(5)-glutamine methyltransferase [Pseudomonadota bacterium]
MDAVLRRAQARIDGTDAEWLLAHALCRPRTWLYTHGSDALAAEDITRYESLVQRRLSGEPIAYLTGMRGFWSLELAVTPHTLIPRPETEVLVEAALARLPAGRSCRVADLGTGSGAIALAIAHERPQAHVIATDASTDALAVAQANAARLRIGNVTFRQGDWLQPLHAETFDVIASNPPYIAADDPHLLEGDLRHEPASALSSGADGLDAIRTIMRGAPAHLVSGGWLMLEHGWEQGDVVRDLFLRAGFVDVATHRDLENRERVTVGRTS